MSMHPARGLSLVVASMDAPTSFISLSHLFVRHFSLQADDIIRPVLAEHNWQQHSDVVTRQMSMEVEMAFGSDAGQSLLHEAALNGTHIQLRIGFPSGQQVSGEAAISLYEVYAEEGDVLRSAFTLHSCGALSVLSV